MDKQAIEQTAVGTIERRVNLTRFLSSYLDRNDKTPSWDGSIYLYHSDRKSADNLIGRVHAQIKGHESTDFGNSEIKFNVKIYHLRNYLNDGGVLFFVVYLCPNEDQTDFETKVYYTELPPAKISDIISKCKTNQQSVSIRLKQLPLNPDDFSSIVWNCYENCKKQASFAGVKLPTVEELSEQGVLESLQMFVSAYGDSPNALAALMKYETPIYAKIKGSVIPQPVIVEDMIDKSCSFDVNEDVKVGNDFFYPKYRVIVTAENITRQIGQSVSIITTEGIPGCIISINLSRMLREFVLDAPFVMAFLKSREFSLDESVCDFSNDRVDLTGIDLGKMEEDYTRYSRYVKMLDYQGCYDDINCSLLTNEDWLNLERLTAATLEETPIHGLRTDLLPYMAMSVGSLKFAIGLFQDSQDKDTYSIRHIQDCDDILFQPEGSDNASFFPICAVFQKEDYIELSNIKFDRITPSLQSYTERTENYNVVNEIMLRIIAASDKTSGTRRVILLNTAIKIADWLLSLPDEIWGKRIAALNKLQITIRQRDLNDEERGLLYGMIAISSDRNDIVFAANALLGKHEEARRHFMLLPKAVQTELSNYPIYRFL